jgi:hypothetical protein
LGSPQREIGEVLAGRITVASFQQHEFAWGLNLARKGELCPLGEYSLHFVYKQWWTLWRGK